MHSHASVRVRGACLAFQAGVARLPGALPGACCLARLASARGACARLVAMRPRSCCHACCHEAVRLTGRARWLYLRPALGRRAQERESGETFNVLNTQLTKGEQ